MLGNHFPLTIHLHGTLTANATFRWKVPAPGFHVKHVSAGQSNAGSATLKLGTTSDDDAILTEYAIGVSGTPNEKTVTDFATTNPTGKLAEGDILLGTLDYDGSSGTAGQNVTIVITLTEGG